MPRRTILDYFFLLRPLILIPVWNFLMIGSFLARGHRGLTSDIIIGLVLYTCVMGGVYILNQIMDRETDRINKKLFLISEGHIPVWHAYIYIAVLWVLALMLSFPYGTLFIIVVLMSMVLGILYSTPPIKLKGKPIMDTLANGLGYGMVNFTVGWLLVSQYDPAMVYRFFPYVLSISAVFVNTTIVDLEGDKATKEFTTAVLLGIPSSYIVSMILMTVAVIWAYMNQDLVCLLPALISLPLFIFTAFYALVKHRIHRKMTIASFRVPGVLFTIVTGYLYPLYAVFLIFLLLIMRAYYKKRFNMVYPTISGG